MKERYPHIEELVGRFLDGTTTNAEERELYAFFAGDDIPEHLLHYREMFAWFEEGIRAEEPVRTRLASGSGSRRRLGLWAAAAAAVAAGVLLWRPAAPGPDFDPFEGSYIVRNGVKITDPQLVRPEIEATLRYVTAEQKAEDRLLYELCADEIGHLLGQWQARKETWDYINSFPEGPVRDEAARRILSNTLTKNRSR